MPLIRDWGIELTTTDEEEKNIVLRILDVAPLVPTDVEDADELTLELERALKVTGRPTPGWEDDGGIGLVSPDRSRFWIVQTTNDASEHCARVFEALLKARERNDEVEPQLGNPGGSHQSIDTAHPPTALLEAI